MVLLMMVLLLCPGHQCTFESGQCNWVNYDNGAYTWVRYRGATPSQNTGPTYDHTTLTAQGKLDIHRLDKYMGAIQGRHLEPKHGTHL